jgi:hypothetical protein
MDKIKYVNHLNQEIDLWGADENKKFIVGSYKGARVYSYSIDNDVLFVEPKQWSALIVCSPKEKANELIELLEADSAKNESGKFYFNDWYIRCKYLGISEIVFENDRFIKLSLNFIAPKNEWTFEKNVVLVSQAAQVQSGLDYPYDFPFDYAGTSSSLNELTNESFIDADFRLRFEGTGTEQTIKIGGHDYSVDNIIEKGQSFFLDTETETVEKSTSAGNVNLFSATSDTDFIFRKLPYGKNKIVWSTDNPLYFTILEHRRIPPWI